MKENGEKINVMDEECHICDLVNKRKIYEGEWKNNKRCGYGVCYCSDDGFKMYVGEWKDDQRHGRGICYDDDGSNYYFGEWEYHKVHGYGVLHKKDDEIKTEKYVGGEWAYGEYVNK